MPDRVPAEGTSCLWNPVLLGGHGVADGDYGDSRPFAMNTFHAGGTGARPGKDGLNATAFPSGVRNTPVAVNETIAPLIFWKTEYRPDAGGPAPRPGGAGPVQANAPSDGTPCAMTCMLDRGTHNKRRRVVGTVVPNRED